MPQVSANPVKPFMDRDAALRNEYHRGGWHSSHVECSDYILPRHGRFLASKVNDGRRIGEKILDPTASRSARILASGMMSGLTSPARPWFRLTTPDPDLAEFKPVKEYLFQVQRRLEIIFQRSNLYNVLPSVYESLGVFGTGGSLSFEDRESLVRFRDMPIGSYFIGQSPRGIVDTVYRRQQFTVSQLVTEFGLNAVSRRVRHLWDNGNVDAWNPVVHAIEPNDDRVPNSPFAKDMAFRSVWYEEGYDIEKPFLRYSGFQEFPAFVPRWWVSGEDIYGRGAGMEALPDVKQLQFMESRKLEAIEKLVAPPTRADPALRTTGVSTLPAGITWAEDGKVEALYQINPQLSEFREEMELVRQRIRSAMFEDLFLMLSQLDRTQITAYEIAERKEEKLLMLGPVLERLNDELLGPLIDRVFAMAERAGLLPEPPPELRGMYLRVEYISVLAQAQKAVAVGGMDRFAAAVGAMAAYNPTVIDKWDMDQHLDEYAEAIGVPPRIVRSDEDVVRVRAERAQQQQVDAMVERAAALAPAAKQASEAVVNDQGETALSSTLRLVGGPG